MGDEGGAGQAKHSPEEDVGGGVFAGAGLVLVVPKERGVAVGDGVLDDGVDEAEGAGQDLLVEGDEGGGDHDAAGAGDVEALGGLDGDVAGGPADVEFEGTLEGAAGWNDGGLEREELDVTVQAAPVVEDGAGGVEGVDLVVVGADGDAEELEGDVDVGPEGHWGGEGRGIGGQVGLTEVSAGLGDGGGRGQQGGSGSALLLGRAGLLGLRRCREEVRKERKDGGEEGVHCFSLGGRRGRGLGEREAWELLKQFTVVMRVEGEVAEVGLGLEKGGGGAGDEVTAGDVLGDGGEVGVGEV